MIDERLVDTIRTKYQYEMKLAVSNMDIELNNPTEDCVNRIDSLVTNFYMAKEKASYFEAILKNLKGEEKKKKK